MEIVIASRNQGKVRELNKILAPLGHTLVSQAELDIPSPPEDGLTFVENALIKARFVSGEVHLPAIADDSGIVVPALGGAPGIYSARYAGDAGDTANNDKLLSELGKLGLADSEPAAYFYCAMVYLETAEDPTPIVATAAWHGRITPDSKGTNGFGYDPLFLVGDGAKTSAELPSEEKNAISHRAQASMALMRLLQARYA